MSEYSFTAEEPQDDYSKEPQVPDGEYRVQITETVYSPNNKKKEDPTQPGAGDWLMVAFEIVSNGNQRGETVKNYFNVVHTNEDVVDIAKRDLSRLCNALGMAEFKAHDELLKKQLLIKTKIKGDFVNIQKYSPVPNDEPEPVVSSNDNMEEPPF